MNGKTDGMIWASLAGDSLALGAHWIYDTERILRDLGRVETLRAPLPGSYHPTKRQGDFTHYGDQTLVLLESVAAKGGFDLEDFASRWLRLFETYGGYLDQATKGTLAGFRAGKGPRDAGSPSDDLAGAARIAPILYVHSGDRDLSKEAAGDQTAMTHRNPAVIQAAEYLAEVTAEVLGGTAPLPALEKAAKGAPPALQGGIREGLASRKEESVSTLVRFGQSCHFPGAFPGVIHLVAKYGEDLREGLIQAVMAGGDSAARAMLVGMICGAHLGMGAIPEAWIAGLRQRDRILALTGALHAGTPPEGTP